MNVNVCYKLFEEFLSFNMFSAQLLREVILKLRLVFMSFKQ